MTPFFKKTKGVRLAAHIYARAARTAPHLSFGLRSLATPAHHFSAVLADLPRSDMSPGDPIDNPGEGAHVAARQARPGVECRRRAFVLMALPA